VGWETGSTGSHSCGVGRVFFSLQVLHFEGEVVKAVEELLEETSKYE
jgi:hypothetical protein